MWKRLILCLLALASVTLIHSEPPSENPTEEANEFIVIHFTNGDLVKFGFSIAESPEISFEPEYDYQYDDVSQQWTETRKGTRINVSTEDNDYYYSFDDVAKITYDLDREPLGGITGPVNENKELTVIIGENNVLLSGCDAGTISIVSLSGISVPVKAVENGTFIDVDTSGLREGIYILTAGRKSFKFAKL